MRPLLDLLAPPRCLACRRPSSPPWCRVCTSRAARHLIAPACSRCGDGASGPHGCWAGDAPIVSTRAAFRYRDVVADTVVAAKVRGASAAWPSLGRLLGRVVACAPGIHAVTYVPTEPRRRRDRGFDHAALLARGVADVLGLAVVASLAAAPGAPDQGARSVTRRPVLPDGIFSNVAALRGASLLLVDDVLTTGVTALAAARALRRGGAGAVHLAVVARAGQHPLGSPAAGPVPLSSPADR